MANPPLDPDALSTFVPLQAVRYGAGSLLGPHFGVMAYHFKADTATSLRAVPCTSDEAFWQKVIKRKLKPGMSVSLEGFRCFDWFPRAPGLYYTERAAWSRRYALEHIYYAYFGERDRSFRSIVTDGSKGGFERVSVS